MSPQTKWTNSNWNYNKLEITITRVHFDLLPSLKTSITHFSRSLIWDNRCRFSISSPKTTTRKKLFFEDLWESRFKLNFQFSFFNLIFLYNIISIPFHSITQKSGLKELLSCWTEHYFTELSKNWVRTEWVMHKGMGKNLQVCKSNLKDKTGIPENLKI